MRFSAGTIDTGVSKLEVVTMMSHLMEPKRDITVAGGGKCLAQWNGDKIEKLGAAQFVRRGQPTLLVELAKAKKGNWAQNCE